MNKSGPNVQKETVFLTQTKTNYLSGSNKDQQQKEKFSKINPFQDIHKKQGYKIILGTPRRTFELLEKFNFESPRTEQAIRNLKLHLDVLFPKYPNFCPSTHLEI